MFVVYTFCALMGVLFVLLPWLGLIPEPADAEVATDEKPRAGVPIWAVGLIGFGLVGVTLDLVGRSLWPTLAGALFAGLPVGLLAAFLGGRIAHR